MQRREVLYSKHALDAQQSLEMLLGNVTDSSIADSICRHYYLDSGEWMWMGTPRQISLCDALDSMLQTHIPSIGFNADVFELSDIHQNLELMHQPDSVANLAQTMATLELALTRAYLKYTVGQRFGFTKPRQLFGKDCYDIELEQADSAFTQQAILMQQTLPNLMKFVNEAEPADTAYQLLKRQLTLDSTDEARHRILCNMERLRWRNKKHPDEAERYVFVNVASQQLWAIGPDSVINMRICCGKPATKTPLLSSEITYIQVNPEWGIPQSIIRGEVSHHAGDSAYFARRNYYITNRKGERVDPRNLTSSQLSSGGYAVRQRSGAGNSLGRIIFRFPNRFSVYLHDTSTPSAFKNDRRTVSHGCVRLQRPFDIAEFVLPNADEWLLDKMRLSMDLKPKTQQGIDYRRKNTGAIRLVNRADVDPSVPVLIDYYTLYPNPQTGKLDHWGDPYGYDKVLLNAIKPYIP